MQIMYWLFIITVLVLQHYHNNFKFTLCCWSMLGIMWQTSVIFCSIAFSLAGVRIFFSNHWKTVLQKLHPMLSRSIYNPITHSLQTSVDYYGSNHRQGAAWYSNRVRLGTPWRLVKWSVLEVLFVFRLFVVYTIFIFKAVVMRSVVSWCLSTCDREIGKRRWKMLETKASKQSNF